ncbi:MAG: chemotaxis protein CheD [Deltaproteobacteria bacterium]|nr:chemotaxis protein CheD [Deltaproteobacteria bacterium]
MSSEPAHTILIPKGQCEVAIDTAAILKTRSLGGCIAVLAHDPVHHVGGLLHVMLPRAVYSRSNSDVLPTLYADTGVPLLLQRMHGLGARTENLTVKLAGGGTLVEAPAVLQLGWRTAVAVRKQLWRAGLLVAAEALGGQHSWEVALLVGTGRVIMSTRGEERQL